jgi:hypothetical protein
VPFQDILDQLQSLNVANVVLLADIADIGPLTHENEVKYDLASRAREALLESNKSMKDGKAPRIWLVLSADDQEISWSSLIHRKSLFQTACIESLKKKEGEGHLNLKDFFSDVQKFVHYHSDGYQNPVLITPDGRRDAMGPAMDVTVALAHEGINSWFPRWFGSAKDSPKEEAESATEVRADGSKKSSGRNTEEKEIVEADDGAEATGRPTSWKSLELAQMNPWEWDRKRRAFSAKNDLKQLAKPSAWKQLQEEFNDPRIQQRDDWKMWELKKGDLEIAARRSALDEAVGLIREVSWWRELISLYPHLPGTYEPMKKDYEKYLESIRLLRESINASGLWQADLEQLKKDIASAKDSSKRLKKKLSELCKEIEGGDKAWVRERQLQILLESPLLSEQDRTDLGEICPKPDSLALYRTDPKKPSSIRNGNLDIRTPLFRHEQLLQESLKELNASTPTPFDRWLIATLTAHLPANSKETEWMFPLDPLGLHFDEIEPIDLAGKTRESRSLRLLRNHGEPLDGSGLQLDTTSSKEIVVKVGDQELSPSELRQLGPIPENGWRLEVTKKEPEKELLGAQQIVLKGWDLKDPTKTTILRFQVRENAERIDLIATQEGREVDEWKVPSLQGANGVFATELVNKLDRERKAVVSLYRVPEMHLASTTQIPEAWKIATSQEVTLPSVGRAKVKWEEKKVPADWDVLDWKLLFRVDELPNDSGNSQGVEKNLGQSKSIASWSIEYRIRPFKPDLSIQANSFDEKGDSCDVIFSMKPDDFKELKRATGIAKLTFEIRELTDESNDGTKSKSLGTETFNDDKLESRKYRYPINEQKAKKRWILDAGGYEDERQIVLDQSDGTPSIRLDSISDGRIEFEQMLLTPPNLPEATEPPEAKSLVPVGQIIYLPSESNKVRKQNLGTLRMGVLLRIPLNHQVLATVTASNADKPTRTWQVGGRVEEVSHFPIFAFLNESQIQIELEPKGQRLFDIPINEENLAEGRYDVTLELRKQNRTERKVSQSFFYDTKPPRMLPPPDKAISISRQSPHPLKPTDEGDASEASAIERVEVTLSNNRAFGGGPQEPDFRMEAGSAFKLSFQQLQKIVSEKNLDEKGFWMRLRIIDRCRNIQEDNGEWELKLVP